MASAKAEVWTIYFISWMFFIEAVLEVEVKVGMGERVPP